MEWQRRLKARGAALRASKGKRTNVKLDAAAQELTPCFFFPSLLVSDVKISHMASQTSENGRHNSCIIIPHAYFLYIAENRGGPYLRDLLAIQIQQLAKVFEIDRCNTRMTLLYTFLLISMHLLNV